VANYGWMDAEIIVVGLMYVAYGVLYLAAGRSAALTAMMCLAGVGLGCCAGCVNCGYHMYYLVSRARRLDAQPSIQVPVSRRSAAGSLPGEVMTPAPPGLRCR
jgi:hypothetical protein